MSKLKQFFAQESGATSIEYGLIGLLISTAIISGVSLIGEEVFRLFSEVGAKVNAAISGSAR